MSLVWYPRIDFDQCIACLVCFEFCPHEVYSLMDDKPQVTKPENCVTNCHGCENQCAAGAISYVDKTGGNRRITF